MKKTFILACVLTVFVTGALLAGGQQDKEKGDKPIKVGIAHINFTHPFYQLWIKSLETVDAHFGTESINKSCEANIEKQLSDIETFIAMGVDVIHVNPIDVVGVEPAVQKAQESSILTLSGCNVVDVKGNCNALLDDYGWYATKAHILAALIGYEGNVCYISGQVGNYASDLRQAGFVETFEKHYPKIKVLDVKPANWDPAQAVAIMEGWLTQYDQIDGIGVQDDGVGLPLLEVLDNAGRKDETLLFGAFGGAPAYDAVMNDDLIGDIALDGEIFAWWTTQVAYRIAMGEKLENTYLDVPFVLKQETYDKLVAAEMPGVEDLFWVTPQDAKNLGAKAPELYGIGSW